MGNLLVVMLTLSLAFDSAYIKGVDITAAPGAQLTPRIPGNGFIPPPRMVTTLAQQTYRS